ncbi:MAG: HAMP domain-containing protein [Anaerolineales bacterium]
MVEGQVIAEFASQQPELWGNESALNNLLLRISSWENARIMFLDPEGRLLVSSDPTDTPRQDTLLTDDDIPIVQQGDIAQHIEFSSGLQQEVIDVFVPVVDPENELVGIVRLSHPYTTVYDELKQMRLLIFGILLFALVAGVGLGSFLAVTINTPIKQVTTAINQLATGNKLEKIEQQGPEEIQSLVGSTNTLFDRLTQLESARKQLLANLVHEIGRPLGALRSAIQSIKLGAGKDPKLLDDLTSGMDAEADRLEHLLDELAHMHDQIFGTLELDRQLIVTKDWLTTLLRPWREAADTKGLEWTVEIPTELHD